MTPSSLCMWVIVVDATEILIRDRVWAHNTLSTLFGSWVIGVYLSFRYHQTPSDLTIPLALESITALVGPPISGAIVSRYEDKAG